MRRMRVLFIDEYLPQEMLGVMYLSRAIKDAGHESKCLFIPDRDWLAKVAEFNPDVVLYSMTTGMHMYFADVNRKVKSVLPHVWAVAGGPHPTFSPEYLKEEGMDAICRGEGEHAIVEFLNLLSEDKSVVNVANFHIKDRETGEIYENPVRPIIKELESIGFPDREVVYEAGAIYRESDRKVFVTQRGCPMPCTFCFHHAMKKNVYGIRNPEYVRKRSVSHVIDEINQVKRNYNLKFVHFVDDIFNLRTDWLEEFCERYPKEVGLPFDVILMANMTTEHHIKLLASAGCVYARIAFEAANDYVRNAIFKKHTTRQQLVDASGWIRKHGIRLGSLNILGGPGGTIEDDIDTLKLNIECKVDHPLASLMQPYPGFEINEITKQMGYAVSAYEDFPVNFRRTMPIEYDDKRAIENLHKMFTLTVRYPFLLPFTRRVVKVGWMYRPLLVLSMLHAEYLVAEQAKLYARAQGLSGPRYWTPVDFAYRLSTKGVFRVYQACFAKLFERFGRAPSQMKIKLQMGDERVVAHMD